MVLFFDRYGLYFASREENLLFNFLIISISENINHATNEIFHNNSSPALLNFITENFR